MKVLLEIEDKSAPALLEVLRGLKYVKIRKKKKSKKGFESLRVQEAQNQVRMAEEGNGKLKPAKEFVDEI